MDAGEGIEKRRRMAKKRTRAEELQENLQKDFKDGNISTRMEAATHYMKMAST